MKINDNIVEDNIKGFIKSFQGIRGYAILLIFISHCSLILNDNGDNIFGWLGALGVEIFIMLSGYLLVMRYNKGNYPKISCILVKRLKKYYPLHILTLIAAIPFSIYKLLGNDALKHMIALLSNIALLQAWIPEQSVYFSFNSVSWYLSLTIFFTLMSKYIIRFLKQINRGKILIMFVILILFEFIWCYILKDSTIAHWLIYIFPVVRCLDFLAGGVYTYCKKKCCINAIMTEKSATCFL